MSENPTERIPASDRRESILAAASRVFGQRGYSGATTDQIAQAAGISQPYVVRMFGTKENLFVEVLQRALDRLVASFRAAIADSEAAGESTEDMERRIGVAYVDLIEDRGILLSLMQGFILGHDPVIGPKAKSGFLLIYQILKTEAGLEPEKISEFLAHGMLLNTLMALRLPDEYETNPDARELIECTFRTKLDMVLGIVGAHAVEDGA